MEGAQLINTAKAPKAPKAAAKATPKDNISRTLSFYLRHNSDGLEMDAEGFVKVSNLLVLEKFQGTTIEDICKVVESCEKKRFKLKKIGEDFFIAANQGHTIKGIEVGQPFVPMESTIVFHGTNCSAWDYIKKSGLSPMDRNHIHFASGLPDDGQVISGMRTNCEVIISIDVFKCIENGIKFIISDNGVILTAGNENGIVPHSLFVSVVDRSGKSLM